LVACVVVGGDLLLQSVFGWQFTNLLGQLTQGGFNFGKGRFGSVFKLLDLTRKPDKVLVG